MTDQAQRTWVVGVPRTTRSDLFASLKLKTRGERLTAIIVATICLILPNVLVMWRNQLFATLVPAALITYFLLWKKDRHGNSLAFNTLHKIGLASAKTGTDYQSGAAFAGIVVQDGIATPRPVAPPSWVGPIRFAESPNGTGIVLLPSQASVTAVIEVRGQGTTRRSADAQASDHDRLTIVLEDLAKQESFIDRIAYIDLVQAPDGTSNIGQLPPTNDMPTTLDTSYRDAWDVTEQSAEEHRYLLVCRMTVTKEVKDLIHSRRVRGERSRVQRYADLMEEQLIGVVSSLHETKHNIVMQATDDGQARETWGLAAMKQYVGTILDPDYSGDGTEHENSLWPTDTDPQTQYIGTLGEYGWHYSRTFVVTDWPEKKVTAGGMTELWTLPNRRESAVRDWAIRRANVLVLELIDPQRGLKTARIEASSDLAALQKKIDKDEISVSSADATNSVQRLVDIDQGHAAPILANVFITVWTDDTDDFTYIERTLRSAAKGTGVKLRAYDGEHGLGRGTALPTCTGIHRDTTWGGKK